MNDYDDPLCGANLPPGAAGSLGINYGQGPSEAAEAIGPFTWYARLKGYEIGTTIYCLETDHALIRRIKHFNTLKGEPEKGEEFEFLIEIINQKLKQMGVITYRTAADQLEDLSKDDTELVLDEETEVDADNRAVQCDLNCPAPHQNENLEELPTVEDSEAEGRVGELCRDPQEPTSSAGAIGAKKTIPSVRIETKRLSLRPFCSSDARSLYSHLSNPSVQRYSLFGLSSLSEATNYIDYTNRTMKEVEWIKWFAITAKDSKTLAGGCSFICRPPHFEAEIGCWIGERHWNKGYGTEATRALVYYGFKVIKTHRIFATCSPGNIPSIRALVKSGLKKEAYLRENIMIRGKWEDSVLFSILEQEWRDLGQVVVSAALNKWPIS